MMDDPYLSELDSYDKEVALEFLTIWLPFLSQDLCAGCSAAVRRRVDSLRRANVQRVFGFDHSEPTNRITPTGWIQENPEPSNPISIDQIVPTGWELYPEPSTNQIAPPVPNPEPSITTYPPLPGPEPSRMSWADMAQEEDELEERESEGERGKGERKLSKEERLMQRFRNIKRKKDYFFEEKVRGRMVNILAGLELHEGVFSPAEQKRIVNFIYELQEKGRKGELGDRTYSEPRKWKRGKGRVTIQFGCNYNYAKDNEGNPPGILRKTSADPIPSLFKLMICRLVRFHVLPTNCVPDSLIVNIYEPGDCIPPHIDSHDFVRPFCTVSFLSECDILFGSELGIVGPGEFDGPRRIPLPVGSVLVLNGNGADVAKHCVPAVPTKRISITFRKMDESKWPDGFSPEPDLQNIIPLPDDSDLNNNNISIDEKGKKSDFHNGNRSRNLNRARKPELERSSHWGNGDVSTKRSEFQSRNSNFGGRIIEGKTTDNYRRPYEMERSSYEGNGEVRTPQRERMGALSVGNNGSVQNRYMQGERSVFSRVSEGMGALSVGNNGSVQSRYAQSERSVFSRVSEGSSGNNGSVSPNGQGERSVFSRVNEGMSALSVGQNGSVQNRYAQSGRSVFSRVSEGTGVLSRGNNGPVLSPNGQGERSVFSRLNEGRALSSGSNGSVLSPNGQIERSVFSRLNEGNNSRYQQRGNNAYFRARTKNNNSYYSNGWRNGQESV
ncbi:hypothetical protein LUZ60_007253 [Juncus effusus]|nr:hypothetical protein LUZ60_007253 [Juncus effusus]